MGLERLNECAIFSGLTEEELEEVREIAIVRSYGPDQIIFQEGEAAKGIYVLLSGRVHIFKSNPEGKEYLRRMVEPLDVFAEAAVFSGTSFPASAKAVIAAEVAFLPKGELRDLVAENPDTALKMMGALSRLLRTVTAAVEDLSLRDVGARLSKYLWEEREKAESDSFDLKIKKQDLATKLGTATETLSRTLRRLQDEGIISVEGRRVKVLDPDLLKVKMGP